MTSIRQPNYKALTYILGALLALVLIGGGILYGQKAQEARTNAAAVDSVRQELQAAKATGAAAAQSLSAALATGPRAVERLEKWIDGDGAFTAAELRTRLHHFVRETARGPRQERCATRAT